MDQPKITCRCNTTRGALCALLVAAASPAFCQWGAVPSGTTSYLKDIFFLNDSVGYCVGGGDMYGYPNGEMAVVLRSEDGGSTWNTVLQQDDAAFSDVTAKGDTVVCFGRSTTVSGLVWTSFDSGNSWQVDSLPLPGVRNPAFLGNDVLFISNQDLVRLGLGTISMDTLFNPNTASIYGLDEGTLYLMTTGKSVHSSADGGSTWDTIPCFMSDSVGIWTEGDGEALYASGDTLAIKITYPDAMAYTTDHGQHWATYLPTLSSDVVFASFDTLYSYMDVNQDGAIMVSTNRGMSSVLQQQLGNRIGKVFTLPGTELGWACGENGMVYRTTSGGFITTVPERTAPAERITVQPNPGHDRLTLVVPFGVQVSSIALLDSSMKQVRHYHSSVRVLNTQGLATGPYLLKIDTDQGTQSIKILLQ